MMKLKGKKGFVVSTLFFFLFTFLLYSPALGEETGNSQNETVYAAGTEAGNENAHSEDLRGDLFDLLYRFINFSLLVIILFIVIKKTKITGYFSARREEIWKKLDDLKKEKLEAENRYLEMEKKVKDFEEKREEIIDQYKREGLAEKEKIIAEAKDRMKQIIDQSEMTIQQEIEAARESLKLDIVELAAQKAREVISREIDENDQDQLVNEFLERVGKEN